MRKLGQHFLKNRSALQLIAKSLDLASDDVVIEIGPGHGELTEFLAGTPAKEIIAIERDENLYQSLVKKFQDDQRITVMLGDALEILSTVTRGPEFLDQSYKVAGNIPYYITGHLFRILSKLSSRPAQCVFTIQKEVAERACGTMPRMNRLAASIQFWADVKVIKTLPPEDFSPPPKVSSAIILLKTIQRTDISSENYYTAVRALFAQPRKTLINNIAEATGQKGDTIAQKLSGIGIAPNHRPQNLSVGDIAHIAKMFFAA